MGGEEEEEERAKHNQLSDFVGDYGTYQLFITSFLFIRYVFLGLMANSGPLMTPDVTFYCSLPMDEIVAIMPNITTLNATEQEAEIKEEMKRICQLDLHLYQQEYLTSGQNKSRPQLRFNSTSRIRECNDFTYDIAVDQGHTMTSEFDLVCDRDWLRSLFQSIISAAIVVAHVFWGTFSDKYGRFKAQKWCMAISLLAGGTSIFTSNFWTFTLSRALCSFSDLGLVVSLTTTVVELVGSRYRGLSVAIVNFGFALGVTLLPYIVAYFEDFRHVVIFTVVCHTATIPFILTMNESIRWLLTNRRLEEAKLELKRVVEWNRTVSFLWGAMFCGFCNRNQCSKSGPNNDTVDFDSMFEELVVHFESQNLYDPISPNTVEPDQNQHEASSSVPQIQVHQPETFKPQLLMVEDKESQKLEEESKSLLEGAKLVESRKISSSANPLSETTSPCLDYTVFITRSGSESIKMEPEMIGNDLDVSTAPQSVVSRFIDKCQTGRLRRAGSCGELDKLRQEPLPVHMQNHGPTEYLDDRDMVKACGTQSNINSPPSITRSMSSSALAVKMVDEDLSQAAYFEFRLRANLQQPPNCINLVANQLSFVGRVNRLFRDKELMLVVFILIWTTFNSEIQYTSYIIINLEVGEDLYLNYVLGGFMEALAAIVASLLLSYAPRRSSLIVFWLMISISCCGLSIAHIDSHWAVWLLALAKFSQSSLSSISSVVAYESFPTFLRQSGSGLVFTIGMLGSVFAPLIFAEFDDQAGMDRVLMTFSLSSLLAAVLIYKFLRETKNCELQ